MKKRLTSFLLVLALSFSLSLPAFAVDDSNYYSLPPVGGSWPSVAMDWPVSTVAEYDSILSQIFTAVTTGNNIASLTQGYVKGIANNVGSLVSSVDSIGKSMASETTLKAILSAVSGITGYATENTLSSFFGMWRYYYDDNTWPIGVNSDGSFILTNWKTLTERVYRNLFTDYEYGTSDLTLRGMVHLLQDTLASDDDRQLAENYKENREQAEQDFLSGNSGPTSLGKGDFSNASQVGGALNDTFNMGGAAKVSDFLSGFGSAGTESQAWFSQTTANNLNALEAGDGTQGVSTFSDDGETMVDVDPDPYNMASIFERYDWLEGVNVDD